MRLDVLEELLIENESWSYAAVRAVETVSVHTTTGEDTAHGGRTPILPLRVGPTGSQPEPVFEVGNDNFRILAPFIKSQRSSFDLNGAIALTAIHSGEVEYTRDGRYTKLFEPLVHNILQGGTIVVVAVFCEFALNAGIKSDDKRIAVDDIESEEFNILNLKGFANLEVHAT